MSLAPMGPNVVKGAAHISMRLSISCWRRFGLVPVLIRLGNSDTGRRCNQLKSIVIMFMMLCSGLIVAVAPDSPSLQHSGYGTGAGQRSLTWATAEMVKGSKDVAQKCRNLRLQRATKSLAHSPIVQKALKSKVRRPFPSMRPGAQSRPGAH